MAPAAVHTHARPPPGPPRYYSKSLRQKYNLNAEVQLPNVVPASADIGWEPDYEKYQARSRRRLEEGGLQSSLPDGWPLKILSKLSWKGQDFNSDRDFTYVLQKHQKAEIDAALQYFKSLGLDGEEVSQDTFPLPHLQHVLRGLSEDLHSGNGFFVLRGLGETARSNEDNFLVYLGVSRYIADQHGRQDQNGNIVGEPSSTDWCSPDLRAMLTGCASSHTRYRRQLTRTTNVTGYQPITGLQVPSVT